MIFSIHQVIICEKLGTVIKQGKIQQSNLYGRLHFLVVLPVVEVVKGAAQVAERAFRPVALIDDLHLKIDDRDNGHDLPKDADGYYYINCIER